MRGATESRHNAEAVSDKVWLQNPLPCDPLFSRSTHLVILSGYLVIISKVVNDSVKAQVSRMRLQWSSTAKQDVMRQRLGYNVLFWIVFVAVASLELAWGS
jgi:hypothetical protein